MSQRIRGALSNALYKSTYTLLYFTLLDCVKKSGEVEYAEHASVNRRAYVLSMLHRFTERTDRSICQMCSPRYRRLGLETAEDWNFAVLVLKDRSRLFRRLITKIATFINFTTCSADL